MGALTYGPITTRIYATKGQRAKQLSRLIALQTPMHGWYPAAEPAERMQQ